MLPIEQVLPELCEQLARHDAVVLRAPTGAGKTTGVPPALLAAGLAEQGLIYLLQPRRMAARSSATRIAQEMHTPLGETVGYQVRFEKRVGPRTRIIALTEGVFLRLLQDDPLLEKGAIVILDEFHERSLNTDLVLAMVRRLQAEFRPDLKLLVMSATLAVEPIARHLGNCPLVSSEGRMFPVRVEYLPHSAPVRPPLVVSAIERLLAQTEGDLLIFLPGVGEIQRVQHLLAHESGLAACVVLPLYGEMPLDKQQQVLAPHAQRKIILATNVAETSITIPGVTGVVDSGQARIMQADPTLGINRLTLERISQASAQQRAGRAGRTAPGVCLRLWTEREQNGLAEFDRPEIERVDLAGAVLELHCWGEEDFASLPWFEPPPPRALEQATALLHDLGALRKDRLTKRGRRMGRLPVHPRLAALLLAGAELGVPDRAALAAALLSERVPQSSRGEGPALPHDLLDQIQLIERGVRLHPRAAWQAIFKVRDQLLDLLGDHEPATLSPGERDAALLRALVPAFADRVIRRRDDGSPRGVMVGGRGVRWFNDQVAYRSELLLGLNVQETGQSEAMVRQACPIEREWLATGHLSHRTEVTFDQARQRLIAWRRTYYRDLLLDEAPTNLPKRADGAAILAQEIASRFAWPDFLSPDALRLAQRVASLRQWMPELELPDWQEMGVPALLAVLCAGCATIDEVRRAAQTNIMKGQLTGQQLAALDREAPERLTVPSGSAIVLDYRPGQAPVLAVRIQELFGLRGTPQIGSRRIPVLIHLLGPNMQPQQVTADLASFWQNTYPQVRKDLRRRYPKHSWPDDPLTAEPQRRPGRRPSS